MFDKIKYERQFSDDYNKFGISKEVKICEDGLRTNPRRLTYEWWYNDAEFGDGTKVVVIFYTKQNFLTFMIPNPTVQIDITKPNGEIITRKISEGYNILINASKDKCDVNIKDCYIKYIDGNYEINYTDEIVKFKMIMKPNIKMWRPKTGHINFGSKYFAWLVPVPSSDVVATLTIDNVTKKLYGQGYHDHNWGNIDMFKMFNHWYWLRAKVGDYTIINSDIISVKKHGYNRYPVFMIAKDGIILEDNENTAKIKREKTIYHPETGKFIDNKITFTNVSKDGTEYKIEYNREKDISVYCITNNNDTPLFIKGYAKINRLNPSYVRCTGIVRLTITKDGKHEIIEQEGLWEQMFFGRNKDAYITDDIK